MSQSDFINYKKTSNELKNQTIQSSVYTTKEYINFKKYSLENTIQNKRIKYNQLLPTNNKLVFGMEKKTTNCPSFILCNNTNTRPNRKLLSGCQITPTPIRPLNEKQINKQITKLDICLCTGY
jgi:hypothetical protein